MYRAVRIIFLFGDYLGGSSYFAAALNTQIKFQTSALKLGERDRLDVESHESAPHGWMRQRVNGGPALLHSHIPKNAGTAFIFDINASATVDDIGFYSIEQCLDTVEQRAPRLPSDTSFVLFRDPRDHVYSQFLECADSPWGQRVTQGHRKFFHSGDSKHFTAWLRHFTNAGFSDQDFGCYHPLNMQTRYLACPTSDDGQPWSIHHAYSNKSFLSTALTRLKEVDVVGVVEQYQESLCLLHAKLTTSLPEWCDCTNQTAWATFAPPSQRSSMKSRAKHGVREHSIADFSTEDAQMIRTLTDDDTKLYDVVRKRFAADLTAVEDRFGMKVSCS